VTHYGGLTGLLGGNLPGFTSRLLFAGNGSTQVPGYVTHYGGLTGLLGVTSQDSHEDYCLQAMAEPKFQFK
jgi:hypothetical protein